MYDGTEQLVSHEGAALSNIFLQKEAEATRLEVRIAKAQEEIKNTFPRNADTTGLEQFRYRDLQARSRFSEAAIHVNQLEQKLDGLRREIARKEEVYDLKQNQLLQARQDVTKMTGTVQGRKVEEDMDFTDISLDSYNQLRNQSAIQESKFATSKFASPYVSSEQEREQARQEAGRAHERQRTQSSDMTSPSFFDCSKPSSPGTELRAGVSAVVSHKYQQVHEDELALMAGEAVTLIAVAEDPGWFYAVHDTSGRRGVVPATHIKRLPRLQIPEMRHI